MGSAFWDRVDETSFPGFARFRDKARQFQTENTQISLDVAVDGVDSGDRDLSVQARWSKTFVDLKGMHRLLSGDCELGFRRQPSGGLLLTSVKGASPF